MLILGAFIRGGGWRKKSRHHEPIGPRMDSAVGDFVGVVDFLVVAGVIFLVARSTRRIGLK